MPIKSYIVIALFLASSLILDLFSFSAPVNATSENGESEGWKTAYTVGKFLYNESSKPDQIFKIQYRVINGTIEEFNAPITNIIAKISTSGNGTLEIRYPRNYPYTNDFSDTFGRDNIEYFVNNMPVDLDIDAPTVSDCFFEFSIPFSGSSEIGFAWVYLATNAPHHGDKIADSCISQTLVENVPTKKDGTIRPLYQVRAGVAPEDVLCPPGLELILNPKGKPYCVTEAIIEFLNKVWYM